MYQDCISYVLDCVPGTGISQNHRYTDTFCDAVDCRFELVQRWTRARSECLPGGGKNYSYATAVYRL